jgi:hypothetical protein
MDLFFLAQKWHTKLRIEQRGDPFKTNKILVAPNMALETWAPGKMGIKKQHLEFSVTIHNRKWS